MFEYNKKLKENSKELRKNMTKEEKHLWYDFLKKLPVNVHRQKRIGNYITDFYIACKKTVIEIDGVQHSIEGWIEKDEERDRYLENLGIKVLRYSNIAVNKAFGDVCDDILKHIGLSFDDLIK